MSEIPEWVQRLTEPDPQTYIPYAGHSKDGRIVLTYDNAAMAMLHLQALPFELLPIAERVGRVEQINSMLRQQADVGRTICFHMVHHPGSTLPPQPRGKPGFISDLLDSYNRVVLSPEKVFRNDWFITVIVKQPAKVSKTRQFLNFFPGGKKVEPLGLTRPGQRTIEDIMRSLMSSLKEYQPRRLGLAEFNTETDDAKIPVSEIGIALYLIRTAHLRVIPHTTGSLAQAIYTEPCVIKRQHFELNIPNVQRVGAMIGLANYPVTPRPGMFNSLMTTDYPCVLSQSFEYRSPGMAAAAAALVMQQMENAGDQAEDLGKGIKDASNAVASLKTASGRHHFGCAVYGNDVFDLDFNVADAKTRLSTFGGAAPVRELSRWYNGALQSAYYLQLPGCTAFKPRPGTITTYDLACMASLESFPQGEKAGYWGPSILRFKTNGRNAFDYVPHVADGGHFGLYGKSGAGKTVLLGLLVAAFRTAMGSQGIHLVIDKDLSNKLLITQAGGVYQAIRRNQDSGLAPLIAFPNTARTVGFLHNTYKWLIHSDNRPEITPDEDNRLKRGIECQLAMPQQLRGMSGIREFLGYADRVNGAGARFERWCAGGSMGWLLDNRQHIVDLKPGLFGIDFTELIPKENQDDDGACSIAAAVILHQLKGLMDGRRIAVFCDESKFYMEPLQQFFDDINLTGRKMEIVMGLLAQQPEHHTGTAIGMALVSQMRTKFIYPDPSLDIDTLKNKLKLSKSAIRLLKGSMTLNGGHRFLLWRPEAESAVIEFDLSELPELPILSGRSWTVDLMEQVQREVSPERVTDEFLHRVKTTNRRIAA